MATSLATHLAPAKPTAAGIEPAWLTRVRQQAWQKLETTELPTVRAEDWKYTSLDLLASREFATRVASPSAAWIEEQTKDLTGGRRLVFVNGRYAEEYSTPSASGDGLEIGPISDRLASERVAAQFSKGGDNVAGFTLLATARFSDGIFIDAGENYSAEEAIDLVYICSGNSACHQRSMIRLGRSAQLTVTEHFISTEDCTGFSNIHLAIELSAKARLNWNRIQRQGVGAFLVTNTQVQQQADSEYNYFGMDTGSRLVRHDIHTRLLESGARTRLTGITVVVKQQHVDNHTYIEHVAPDCTSRERFKAVAGGRSRVVFNGKIKVHPGADGTDSSQSNANLLLSPHAEIDTKPELEIYADEVIAAHGATVGQLDENSVFYLRTRGLSEHEARQLLIRGFCRELVDWIAHEPLRDLVDAFLVEALPETGTG